MQIKTIIAGHTTGNSTAVNLSVGQDISPTDAPFEAWAGKTAIAAILPSATSDRAAKLQGSVDAAFTSPVDLLAQAAVGRPIMGKVQIYPYMRLSTTTAGTAGDTSCWIFDE